MAPTSPNQLLPDLTPAHLELISTLQSAGYTGIDLHDRPQTCELLVRLIAEGFDVKPSGKSGTSKAGTIVIAWKKQYVGIAGLIPTRPDLLLCYHFRRGRPRRGNAIPANFSLTEFCTVRGLREVAFALDPKTGDGEKYLYACDLETAITLMRQSAAEVDPTYHVRESSTTATAIKAAPTTSAAQWHEGRRLVSECEDAAAFQEPPAPASRDARLAEDLAALAHDPSLDEPTRKRLVDARCGQGRFRTALDTIFGNRCAVTNVGVREVLRASHIHAWRLCESAEEKLDPNNGLLLSANLDALFDRYLITFASDGALVLSDRITAADLQLLGPVRKLRMTPSPEQAQYLRQHNEEFRRRRAREHVAFDAKPVVKS